MENVKRDWVKEFDAVNSAPQTKYLRLKTGLPYTVTFIDEGGVDYPSEFGERVITRIDFKVKVSGGEYNTDELVWSITKGGKESLYGKLCRLFSLNGRAAGYTVHIMSQGEGRDRKYQIKEFNDLIFK